MTINEKIHLIRINKRMSQAELAYKTEISIKEVIDFETNGTLITGFDLLKIIGAFELTISEFQSL